MTLADLGSGNTARVTAVEGGTPVVRRLMEMGLVRGAQVSVRQIAPFGDPMQLRVGDYTLSIRKAEARRFSVESDG